MDQHGSAVGTQRSTRARTEQCPVTEGSPGADGLGVLSDELLLYILSFLGIREAVSTSSVSRRWRSLYRRLPYLDFSSEVWDSSSAWFIDRVLLLHAEPRIVAFYLSMRVSGQNSATCRQIDSWLLFAVRRHVQELDLDFQVHDPYHLVRNAVSYDLPPWIFHCGTLDYFFVQNCRLRLPAHIRLVSLTRLSLNRIEFQYDELKRLLPGCPLLQSLELVHCNRESHLDIDARENPKLEELVIVDENEYYDPDDPQRSHMMMQIVAPSVKHLIFEGAAFRRRYEVRDLSSLTAASFHLDESRAVIEDEAKVFSTGLLRHVRQVRELKLCWWSLQALEERELRDDWASAFLSVTTLELRIKLQKDDEMLAILSALRACNKLRTLVLSIIRPTFYERSDSDEMERSLARYSDIVMQELRTITISGLTRSNEGHGEKGREGEDFVAWEKQNDIVLIGFLLKVSPALEKLIVHPSKDIDVMARKWELLFNLSSHLLSLPRASPNANVIIDGK